jgi:hypothetical protein
MLGFVKAASYVLVRPGIPIPPGVVFHEATKSDPPNLGLNENRVAMHMLTNVSKMHEMMSSLRRYPAIRRLDAAMQRFDRFESCAAEASMFARFHT